MLRFFRHTRKSLIMPENVRKYLLYAVGEILLVVIGILIALQINNWNEERKIRAEEVEILNILQEDLQSARLQSLQYLRREARDSISIVQVLNPTIFDRLITEGKADSMVYSAIWEITHDVPVIKTYNDLKYSGKTGVIRNQQIRNQLSALEVRINSLTTLLADRLSVHQIRIDDIAANEVNFLHLISFIKPEYRPLVTGNRNSFEDIRSKQKTRNLLAIKLELTSAAINYRRELLQEIDEILELIGQELSKIEGN